MSGRTMVQLSLVNLSDAGAKVLAKQEDDICKNRHRGADTSVLANAQANKDQDRAAILGLVKLAGLDGLTLSQACQLLGKDANRISGRFTELVRDGKVRIDGRRQNPRGNWERVYVAS